MSSNSPAGMLLTTKGAKLCYAWKASNLRQSLNTELVHFQHAGGHIG